jgi:hypothetical protein
MTQQETTETLSALVRLDVDAVVSYDRAIAAVGDGPIANQLALFKLDHQRHVVELSRALLDLDVRPPGASPDMKGTLLGGVTALRARLGSEQALRAMRVNEQPGWSGRSTSGAGSRGRAGAPEPSAPDLALGRDYPAFWYSSSNCRYRYTLPARGAILSA